MLCRIRSSASHLCSSWLSPARSRKPQLAPHPPCDQISAPVATPREQRAIRAFNTAKQSPLEFTAFLDRMPKGDDLHMHLVGAVYAETFIRNAAADLLCVNPKTMSFFKPAATTRSFRRAVLAKATTAPRVPSRTRSSTTPSSTPSPCAALSPVPASVAMTSSSPPSTASEGSTSPTWANGRRGRHSRGCPERTVPRNHGTPTFVDAAKEAGSIGWPDGLPSVPKSNR